MTAVTLSTRIRFVNDDGTLTPEAYRTLSEILNRTGGVIGNSGGDTIVTNNDFASIEAQQSAGSDITSDTFSGAEAQALGDMTTQTIGQSAIGEMVMQPPSDALFMDLPRYPTASGPAYAKGRLYFDTTLNKARIGGATAYETITSA